jgi:hypothetical protein
MLFWAATIPEIEDSILSEILNNHEAYPEAPMFLKNNQTSFHAVTSDVKNEKKF